MQNLFYRNSRLSALVIGLILVSGLSSFALLPRMEDPLLTPRFAMINTRLPGADAERVESLVSDKIENELHDISEIKEIRSVSRSGVSTITLELRGDVYEVDTVWSRIRDRIDEATVHLPPEASDPEFDELDVKAYAQIVALKWAPESPQSTEPNNAILRRLAEDLKDVLEAAPGTEKVDIFGDPDEEMVVEISAADLAAYGLTVDEVARQLAASDAKVSSGHLRNSSDLDHRGRRRARLDSADCANTGAVWLRRTVRPTQQRGDRAQEHCRSPEQSRSCRRTTGDCAGRDGAVHHAAGHLVGEYYRCRRRLRGDASARDRTDAGF